jgi:hypothetical protein
MTTIYEDLINELKIKCELKGIKFTKKNFKKIINKNITDKNKNTKKRLDDDELIEKIVTELEVKAKKLQEILEADLKVLNELLIIFGEETQPSKTKAKKILKTQVFINIHDFVEEKYEKRTTEELLIRDIKNNPDRAFPLAKIREKSKKFLQHIYN